MRKELKEIKKAVDEYIENHGVRMYVSDFDEYKLVRGVE